MVAQQLAVRPPRQLGHAQVQADFFAVIVFEGAIARLLTPDDNRRHFAEA